MIYYSSDLHFNHLNIIKSCNRPFESLEEMNNIIIKNWNDRVRNEDFIYFLGDFGVPKNLKDVEAILSLVKKLNGRKILIQGNHDARLLKNSEFCSLFEEITIYKKISDNGHFVVLMHYPLETWERSYYGSYHLHGHIHTKEINYIPNRFNVGVDVNNYKPVTLTELIDRDNDSQKDEVDLLIDKFMDELKLVGFGFKCEMRDINRIEIILDKLKIYWLKHPDLRLGQIISNFGYEVRGENDPFYVEDDLMLKVIEEKLKK